ncbi:protein indeterminate-domain 16-like [Phragmites australis]|uniref:protein indeterminate-domain 16-like n=1 Tax=Phragmites australis TaxID=29695 RepID=UPI002D798459|nr:protein indeterminate-domain 16-like [Phragmites australis]
MDEQGDRELQLQFQLLLPAPTARVLRDAPAALVSATDHTQLDLDLSMSIGPRHPPAPPPSPPANENRRASATAAGARQLQQHHQQLAAGDVRAVKQQAAEQARMASAERAYAERVRELARRELELAEREFARARAIWESAREEVKRVERMKQIAARRLVGSASSAAALEITCHACMQRFHP